MDINILVKVTSRAWSLNILSLMHSGIAGRQSLLLSATDAGRTAFTQSLRHLFDLGLLENNPGHGHPLRSEFRLTLKGVEVAVFANKITYAAHKPLDSVLLRRAWSVPILMVSQKPLHFIQIKTQLRTITDRALSQSLKQLQARNWLRRKIDTKMRPPRPLYQAANIGALISQAICLDAI